MSFLAILLTTTALAAVVRRRAGPRNWARAGLGAALAFAGVTHLLRPEPFEQHLPGWVPAAPALVVVTGFIEIGLGLALVAWSSRRRLLGLTTAGYLLVVLPANVYVAVAGVDVDGQPDGPYAWIRLPLQGLFIAWALWSTGASPHRDGRSGGALARSVASLRQGDRLDPPGGERLSPSASRSRR